MARSRKRKTEFGREIEDYYSNKRNQFDVTYEEDLDLLSVRLASSEEVFYNQNRGGGPRKARADRTESKIQWKNVYKIWNGE